MISSPMYRTCALDVVHDRLHELRPGGALRDVASSYFRVGRELNCPVVCDSGPTEPPGGCRPAAKAMRPREGGGGGMERAPMQLRMRRPAAGDAARHAACRDACASKRCRHRANVERGSETCAGRDQLGGIQGDFPRLRSEVAQLALCSATLVSLGSINRLGGVVPACSVRCLLCAPVLSGGLPREFRIDYPS